MQTTPLTNGAADVADDKSKNKMAITSVPVAPGFFTDMLFLGAEPKMITHRGGQRLPLDQQQQETTPDGVPKWRLRVDTWLPAKNNRPAEQHGLNFSVAMRDDPNTVVRRGDPVELDGVWFGVMVQTNGNVTTWQNCTGIRALRPSNSDK